MANNLGRLQASVTADVSGFKSNLKQAEVAAQGFKDKAAKSFGDLGNKISSINPQIGGLVGSLAKASTAVAAIGSAAGAGLFAMITSAAEAAKEVQNLATVSGASITEFQRWAVASASVGIEQEKLSDIFKDLREKMGEAQVYGTGAFTDALQTLGKQTGLTMESFKGLTGPESLQLIVTRMQGAGLSTEQMSAVLESLASDSTLLIPILRDNGAALKEMGDRAAETGVIVDDLTHNRLVQMGEEVSRVQSAATGFANGLVSEVVPEILTMIKHLDGSSGALEQLGKWARAIADVLVKVLGGAVVTVSSMFEYLGKSIGGVAAAMMRALTGDFEGARFILSELGNDLVKLERDWQAAVSRLAKGSEIGLTVSSNAPNSSPVTISGGTAPKVIVPKATAPKGSGAQPNSGKGDMDAFLSGLEDKAFEETEKRKQALISETLSAKVSAFHQELSMIEALREQGKITEEDSIRLIESKAQAFDYLYEASEKTEGKIIGFQDIANQAEKTLSQAFMDFATSADQSFSDFARNFLKQIAQMIQQAILLNTIKQIGSSMAGSSSGWVATIGQTLIGSKNGNVFTPGAGGPNLIPFANGGVFGSPVTFPMAGGKTGLMGEAGPEAIMPLSRKNGRLGVDASGMGGTVNNYNVSVQVESNSSNPDAVGNAVAEKVMRAIARQEIANSRRIGNAMNPI